MDKQNLEKDKELVLDSLKKAKAARELSESLKGRVLIFSKVFIGCYGFY